MAYNGLVYPVNHLLMAKTIAAQERDRAYNQYQQTFEKYSGQKGMDLAKTSAGKTAQSQALNQANQQGLNAEKQARQAGLSKAMSANLGAKSSNEAYNQAYNQSYQTNLQANLQNNQQAIQQAQDAYKNAQSLQNEEYNKGWAEISFITSLFGLSDEKTKVILDRWKSEGDSK
ncbi:hypothetical protein [Methanobrevibacter sp.]|uniref:hypothetical protein n=1 Tax=Methanobrevibacter sp. TaxID=66852 RepID=UPI0038906E6E